MPSDWPNEPGAEREFREPPGPGLGGGSKMVLVLVAIFGGSVVLCCGGVLWFSLRFRTAMFNEDPEAVRSMTREIAEIEIPERFRPMGVSDFSVMPFFGAEAEKEGVPRMVVYDADDGSLLTLMDFRRDPFSGEAQTEDQLLNLIRTQGRSLPLLEPDDDSLETREFEVRGEQVPFEFTTARDPRNGRTYRQVKGGYAKNGGREVSIRIVVPDEQFDEAEVERIVGSIE